MEQIAIKKNKKGPATGAEELSSKNNTKKSHAKKQRDRMRGTVLEQR